MIISAYQKFDGVEEETYVYLLMQKMGAYFKIGISNDPQRRADEIEVVVGLDRALSVMVLYPSRRRALKVERSMHGALNDFRISLDCFSSNVIGHTEWFRIEGWDLAVNLIKRIPTHKNAHAKLLGLGGDVLTDMEALTENHYRAMRTELDEVIHSNMRNFNRLSAAFFKVASCVLKGELQIEKSNMKIAPQALDVKGCANKVTKFSVLQIKIKGLHRRWDAEELRLRFALMDTSLYQLRTYSKRPGKATVSLLKRIEKLNVAGDELVLQVFDGPWLKKLPAGGDLYERWVYLLSYLDVVIKKKRIETAFG